eukprot:COSAG06_NODE_57626_length_279_cov_2.022222_1_plen_86_part_10
MFAQLGSWNTTACCAVKGNECDGVGLQLVCDDHTSAGDWLFELGAYRSLKFGPTGIGGDYQCVDPDAWPQWGAQGYGLDQYDLSLG